jgi:bacterioferritin-associated ferredoxin
MSMRSCPACGGPGLPVEQITIAAHAKESTWPLGDGPFFHCPSTGCDVIYFTHPEGRQFRKGDVKTRVTFKEEEAPRPLCYCKQVTEEDVLAAVAGGARTFDEVVAATGIGGGGQCKVTNPAGRCCSRNYKPFIEEALAEARSSAKTGTRSHDRPRRERRPRA